MDSDLVHLLDGVVDKLDGFLPAEFSRRGRPGYPVSSMIACFLVMFLKDLRSERDLAAYLKNNLYLLKPLRLPKAPVSTTLGRFRKRFGSEKLTEVVDKFGSELQISGEIVVDSALMEKEDPEGEWGYSDSKGWIYGFKVHVSCDADNGLPLRIRLSTANRHDCPYLPTLTKGLNFQAVIGDSGYDSENNINYVLENNAFPAIAFNKRAEKGKGFSNIKSNRHKLRKKRKRKKLLKKRYIVEQLNNLLHEILELKNRFIKGLEACAFYAQIAALQLLTQAQWAIETGVPHIKRQIKYFQRQ